MSRIPPRAPSVIIPKKASDKERDLLPFRYFPRARDAFEHVLRLPAHRGRTVLLPAYIGYGRVEGSGVFDPVRRAKKPYAFYRMKGLLEIDPASARAGIRENPGAILLLVHYFGFKDAAVAELKEYAARHDGVVVEDFAHGLYTFLARPVVDFDFAFFSLHKMLPVRNRTGGLLLSRRPARGVRGYTGFQEFNLGGIAARRRANYTAALERLRSASPPGLVILRPELGDHVPESFPILLENRTIRDRTHARMNAAGFGLISLYHELIADVDASYRTERDVSDRITNLPIHQDADPPRVQRMVDALVEILAESRKGA